MAPDLATLIGLKDSLLKKVQAGSATEDDIRTLDAVISLLEEAVNCQLPKGQRRARIAVKVVQDCHNYDRIEGQKWYGKGTIERMEWEADAEKKLASNDTAAEPPAASQASGRPSKESERLSAAAAERVAAAERAMAARHKEEQARERAERQRQDEHERRLAEKQAQWAREERALQKAREEAAALLKAREEAGRRKPREEAEHRHTEVASQARPMEVEPTNAYRCYACQLSFSTEAERQKHISDKLAYRESSFCAQLQASRYAQEHSYRDVVVRNVRPAGLPSDSARAATATPFEKTAQAVGAVAAVAGVVAAGVASSLLRR